MSLPPPSFYDSLDETLAEAWRLITRGVADRRSPFHHPALATVGLAGAPEVRTVILRGCDPVTRRLRFHTDGRSAKVAELAARPDVALHFYDPAAKIQVRARGRASLHRDDVVADAAWAGSRVFSRQCYGIAPGPGADIGTGGDFMLPETTEVETAAGRVNFTAVMIDVRSFEWLYLANAGHRRARFSWDDGALTAGWLAP
jgi:pyridoxamine 5'-phosphate oxidase